MLLLNKIFPILILKAGTTFRTRSNENIVIKEFIPYLLSVFCIDILSSHLALFKLFSNSIVSSETKPSSPFDMCLFFVFTLERMPF